MRQRPDLFLRAMSEAYGNAFCFLSPSHMKLINFVSSPDERIQSLVTSSQHLPTASTESESEAEAIEAVDWYLDKEMGDSGSADLVNTFRHLALITALKVSFEGNLWKDSDLRESIIDFSRRSSTASKRRKLLVERLGQELHKLRATSHSHQLSISQRNDLRAEGLLDCLIERMTNSAAVVANCCRHILHEGLLGSVEREAGDATSLQDLKGILQCLAEAARLYVPVVSSVRLSGPVAYEQFCFEEGDILAISPYLLARQDTSREAPEEFRPFRGTRTTCTSVSQAVALWRLVEQFNLTLLRRDERLDWDTMAPCTLYVYYQRKSYGIKSKFV